MRENIQIKMVWTEYRWKTLVDSHNEGVKYNKTRLQLFIDKNSPDRSIDDEHKGLEGYNTKYLRKKRSRR